MIRKSFGLVIVFLLIAANAYAADGDLIVNGNLGVGTTTPTQRLDVAGYVKGQTGLCIGSDCRISWPGGGLTGSGSTNYVPKWTGTSSLGNSLIYDNGTNIGIGTTSPQAKLDVVGGIRLGPDVFISGVSTNKWLIRSPADGRTDLYLVPWTGTAWNWYNVFTFSYNGGLGIGLTAPTSRLHLSADSAAKPSTNTWTISSDARLKTNIFPYTKGLKEILQINPVTYKYNGKGGIGHNKIRFKDPATGEDTETETVDTELLAKTNVGVIAQDIQAVVPEAVSSHKGKINEDDAEETDILDFNSHSLTFILINAVKELNAQIDSLKEQIADLKTKVK